MSDYQCRLLDIDLVVLPDRSDFGSPTSDGDQQIKIAAWLRGTDADDLGSQLASLASRVALGGPLVVNMKDGSHPVAVTLRPGGVLHESFTNREILTHTALVEIETVRAPYATPANRVFLANPIGDEWPDTTDIARAVGTAFYVEHFVYAEAGRYCLIADGTTEKASLVFYGALEGDEAVVVEFDYEVEYQTTSNGLFASFNARETKTGSNIESVTLLNTTSTGRGHFRGVYRVPSSTPYFALGFYSLDTAGEVRAYVWNVQVGVKRLSTHRLLPYCPPDPGVGDLCWGWSIPDPAVSGVTWTTTTDSGGNYLRCNSATAGTAAHAVSLTDHDTYAGALPVTPGRRLGVRFFAGCAAYTSGTFEVNLVFREDDGTLVSRTQLVAYTSTTSAATQYDCAVPEKASLAYLEFGVTAAGAVLNGVMRQINMGEYLLECPGTVSLAATQGEVAAPLEVWGNVDVESDAHLVTYAIGTCDGTPYVFEAEALTWTGGTTATTTSADDYPGTGNTGKKNTGTTASSATIDTSECRRGTYELWVRARSNNVSYTGTLGCTQSGKTATTALTTPSWLSLGQVKLPPSRTLPGTAANITVTMVSDNASGYVQVDRYLLVPLTHGGAVTYHPSVATTDCSSFDVLVDGTPLVDSAADYDNTICGGPLIATADDRLVVNAEEAASNEATHLVALEILHTPRYSLWRGD